MDRTYNIFGEGKPVLVVGSHLYYPRIFSENLLSRFKFIFMSHSGFLPEPEIEIPSLESLCQEVEVVRKELKLEKFIILGHSIHAFMAIEYTKRFPQYIEKTILIASSPMLGPCLHEAAHRYFEESICPERKKLFYENLSIADEIYRQKCDSPFIARMLKFGPMIWYNPSFDASFLWKNVRMNEKIAQVIWGHLFEDYDTQESFKQIHSPILIVLGRYDYFNPPHLWEPMRQYFNDVKIKILEKSGHTPQLEESNLFDQLFMEYLNISYQEDS